MNRPTTTLFMLMSVDGKISTGETDEMDVDQDFPQITGLKEGHIQGWRMDAGEATDAFLKESGMTAPAGVGYCLAVRKG